MPTPEQVRAAVDAYVDAYERTDRDAFLALWSDGACLEDPVGSPACIGTEAIGAFWDGAHDMASRISLAPSDVIVCAHEAAMIFTISAYVGDGGLRIDAVDVFSVDDHGRIAGMKAYWDMTRARPFDPAR